MRLFSERHLRQSLLRRRVPGDSVLPGSVSKVGNLPSGRLVVAAGRTKTALLLKQGQYQRLCRTVATSALKGFGRSRRRLRSARGGGPRGTTGCGSVERTAWARQLDAELETARDRCVRSIRNRGPHRVGAQLEAQLERADRVGAVSASGGRGARAIRAAPPTGTGGDARAASDAEQSRAVRLGRRLRLGRPEPAQMQRSVMRPGQRSSAHRHCRRRSPVPSHPSGEDIPTTGRDGGSCGPAQN